VLWQCARVRLRPSLAGLSWPSSCHCLGFREPGFHEGNAGRPISSYHKTFGPMSRGVHQGRYLPNLGNDIPLVCSYKGQHEICTAYSCCNRGGLASVYEAGPLPFLALGLPPVRIGRFRVCPAARPQPRLALILLLSGLPAPWVRSDQRDSNCATSEPGGFGMSYHQITTRGCGPPLSQGEIR
jgi:hypothetical protein